MFYLLRDALLVDCDTHQQVDEVVILEEEPRESLVVGLVYTLHRTGGSYTTIVS